MKICRNCKNSKKLEEYHKNCHMKDGRHRHCKECRKKEYIVCPERKKERSRELSELHKGNSYSLGRKDTSTQLKEKSERSRQRNFRKGYEYSAGNATSPLKRLYKRYEKNALVNKREWSLDIETFRNITKENCAYCGKSPSQRVLGYRSADYFYEYNGIDRVDNSVGYIKNNCVACCEKCNKGKLKMSVKEFLDWIQSVYLFQMNRTNA